jgi:hypothetical protein
MEASYSGPRSRATRPFINVAYLPANDRFEPVSLPDRCLRDEPSEATAKGTEGCRIVVHDWRSRVTGPGFPLCVVECTTHGRHFTLYPPAYVPYSRVAVAPVGLDGEIVLGAPAAGPAPDAAPDAAPADAPADAATAHGAPGWDATLFGAALDAANGIAWSREPAADDPRRWQTQRRHISTAALLLGLDASLGDVERDVRARELHLPALRLRDEAREWSTAGGYKSRGKVVASITGELTDARCVLDHILCAGMRAGLWGRAYRWESHTRALRDLLGHRTRPP